MSPAQVVLLHQGNVLWDERENPVPQWDSLGQSRDRDLGRRGEGAAGRRSPETVQASPGSNSTPMKGFWKLMGMATPSSFVPCCLCPGHSVSCDCSPSHFSGK